MVDRVNQDYKKYYDILSEPIGKGAYGFVYKGKEKETGQLRAIKVIYKNQLIENLSYKYEPKEIEEQLKLCINGFISKFENMKIRSTNNNNSVKCYEYFNNDDNFTIIMELCDKNLLQLLMEKIKKDKKCFNIEEILEIMKQLNNALKIMKENKIIHRNLKLENILIKYNDKEKKKYTIKLTDYGCSKRLESLSKNYGNTPNIGTNYYMAPEILKGEEYNYKVDL